MKTLNTQSILIRVSFGLGVLSLVAMLFAHLALTDIRHGEADVSLEWNIVRCTAVVLLAFIGLSLTTFWRSLAGRAA